MKTRLSDDETVAVIIRLHPIMYRELEAAAHECQANRIDKYTAAMFARECVEAALADRRLERICP